MSNSYQKEYENIHNSISEDILHDIKIVHEYLESNGYDVDKINIDGNEFINTLKRKSKYALAEIKRDKYRKFQKLFEDLQQKSSVTINELADYFSNGDKVAFENYYNRLKQISKEDLEQIKNEQQFLNWLDRFDESNDRS